MMHLCIIYHKKTIMKKLYFPAVILLMLCFSSCAVIGGIFKAGAVVGIIAVVIVIAIIIWIASLFRGKN
jgi:4-hydroxybenzoate polyprenyltransferase